MNRGVNNQSNINRKGVEYSQRMQDVPMYFQFFAWYISSKMELPVLVFPSKRMFEQNRIHLPPTKIELILFIYIIHLHYTYFV